jgi:hypothetical protein
VVVNTRNGAFLPMETAGTQHLVDRTYRESGPFQWARETYINAREAGATRVEFGIEWQAVANQGVYRRMIADNGSGMDAEQLVEFFNTYGGGGKPIGGVHENFGVGAKTSLLPWNKYGIVVVSWVDGDASMIWIYQNPETGEYGLKVERAADPDSGEVSLEAVYDPYDDEDHGCDWESIKPDWIGDSGTVIVLLGDSSEDDTVRGDPNRDGAETDIKGLSSFLNRRIWEIDEDVELYVDELRTNERKQWPPSETIAHGPVLQAAADRRTNTRRILGAMYFIEYARASYKPGKLQAKGTAMLTDGTQVLWFLWEGKRPDIHSYAAKSGFIGALYNNELYNVTSHHSTYRSFGIVEQSVRQNLWLILKPPALGDGKHGVYPRNDRNALLLKGGPNAGGELPVSDWAGEFADEHMPDAVMAAITASRTKDGGTLDDASWRERLAERFGSRWRISKLRVRKNGPLLVDPTQAGSHSVSAKTKSVRRKKRGAPSTPGGGRSGATNTGSRPGSSMGAEMKVAGGIPRYRPVSASELGEGMLAAWQPHDPLYKEGAVLINIEHEVLREQIANWQSQYPEHYAQDIEREVIDVYGQIAVSKVAHSEFLKGIVPAQIVEKELRSEGALTMALLGLMAEEAVLATRIGGKFSRKKKAA